MQMIRAFASSKLRRFARTVLYGSNGQKPISSPLSERLDSRFGERTLNMNQQFPEEEKRTNNEHSNTRVRWAFGSMLSLFLPLWKSKWGKLLTLEDEVEKAAQVVETTAELVEMVADAAEALSTEVAEKLPEDGKLKDAVLFIEHVSKEAEKDAQLTIEFIHKVHELKQDVESLVEPAIHPLKHAEKQAKDK